MAITTHVQNLLDQDPPFGNGGVLCGECDEKRIDPTGQAIGITVRGGF